MGHLPGGSDTHLMSLGDCPFGKAQGKFREVIDKPCVKGCPSQSCADSSWVQTLDLKPWALQYELIRHTGQGPACFRNGSGYFLFTFLCMQPSSPSHVEASITLGKNYIFFSNNAKRRTALFPSSDICSLVAVSQES